MSQKFKGYSMKNFIVTLLLLMMTTSSFAFTNSECAELKADLDIVAVRMKYVNASKKERDLTKQSLVNYKKWVERKYAAMEAVEVLPWIGALAASIAIYRETKNSSLLIRGISIVALPFLVAITGRVSSYVHSTLEGLPFERQADLKFIDEEIKKLKEIDSQIDQGKTQQLKNDLLKIQKQLTEMAESCN